MNSMLDGTSRLSQVALCTFVFAVVITGCSALVTGAAKLGPAVMVIAGAMALVTYVRDREDQGMWPAYVTFAAVCIGLLFSIPLLLNSSGMHAIAADGQLAHSELIPAQGAIGTALSECAHDGNYGNCSPASIAAVPVAAQANARTGRDCTTAGVVCISDGGVTGYLIEYITRPVKSVGSLRFQETRTIQNRVISTTCEAVSATADPTQVRAACGPGVVVNLTAHS